MTRIQQAAWVSLAAGDAIAFAYVLGSAVSPARLGGAIMGHFGVAVLAAALAPAVARPRQRAAVLACVAGVVALFVPVFGVVALGAWVSQGRGFGFGARPPRQEDPWRTLAVPEGDAAPATRRRPAPRFATAAPFGLLADRPATAAPLGLGADRGPGSGTIAAALRERSPESAARRFHALLAARRLPARAAVALYKQALKDPSDEVRLLAFARIDRMCDDLDASTKRLLAALEGCEPGEGGVLHLRLAETYWEWGYLRLAEGSVLDHAMRESLAHAEKAASSPDQRAPAAFLRGRVLMALERHEEAHEAFGEAQRSGFPAHKALPYIAECAFRLRRFDAVRTAVRELEDSAPGHAALHPIAGFWQ